MDEMALKVRRNIWLSRTHEDANTYSQIYDALAYHVTQSNIDHRLKTVSLWSLQITANAILSTVKNVLDPAAAHIRDMYSM